MHLRPLPRALLLAVALVSSAGCSKPTEIVVRLVALDTPPPYVVVKLHRSVPFADNPAMTPPYVVAALNGADLDLTVVPQGRETVLSLLPNKLAGNDLRITVTAPGFAVAPAMPVDTMFVEDQSQELRWDISAPPPDGGVKDGGRDMAGPKDGGARDGGSMDLAAPMDLASKG